MKERLQKIISHAGVCSRRKAEELILAGKVKVNGVVVRELGSEADVRKDRIEVSERVIRPEPLKYFLFHKPDGVIIFRACVNVFSRSVVWIIIRKGFLS